MALRGRWRSYSALFIALRGINGRAGGYYHDLGGRIYPRLIRPEDGLKVQLPFACLPLVETTPQYETTDSGLVACTWRLSVFAFVNETQRGLDSDISEQCLKLHDDIQRCVLLDPKLGGTAQDTRWVNGGGELAAVLPGEQYGELEVPLEIVNFYAVADLGPAAIAA